VATKIAGRVVPDVFVEGFPYGRGSEEPFLERRAFGKDDVKGNFSRAKMRTSLSKTFIKSNPTHGATMITADIDFFEASDALRWAVDDGLPAPHFYVENPATRHGHAAWMVKKGFDLDNPRAKWLHGRIQSAITSLIEGADPAYTGHSMRSPFYPGHDAEFMHDELYDGNELIERLGIDLHPTRRGAAVPVEAVELAGSAGRNDFLFHTGRQWAYREQRRHDDKGSFSDAVREYLHHLNDTHVSIRSRYGMLDPREVDILALNISNWVWQYMSGGEGSRGEAFVMRQVQRAHRRWDIERERSAPEVISAASSRSINTRWDKTRIWLPGQVDTMANAGKSTREIAAVTGTSTRSARRAVAVASDTTSTRSEVAASAAAARWVSKADAISAVHRMLDAGQPPARVAEWADGTISRQHVYRLHRARTTL